MIDTAKASATIRAALLSSTGMGTEDICSIVRSALGIDAPKTSQEKAAYLEVRSWTIRHLRENYTNENPGRGRPARWVID